MNTEKDQKITKTLRAGWEPDVLTKLTTTANVFQTGAISNPFQVNIGIMTEVTNIGKAVILFFSH